jgi:hypothetical protein
MKKFLIMIVFVFVAGFVNAGYTSKGLEMKKRPIIAFNVMVHDFGTMKEGDVVNYVFTFTNKGNEPLIVEEVEQPCGCTIPSWSKAPVMPGKTGEIKVIFNSNERPGVFRKTLAVKSNVPAKLNEPLLLMIKGTVLTKKQWKTQKGNAPSSTSKK